MNECQQEMRFNLFTMAQELDICELTDLAGAKIACDMNSMTIDQQRSYLGIKNDRTEDEIAQVRSEIETAATYLAWNFQVKRV